MRILVVDDERQITRVLRTSLQSSGYEVVVANDGSEAFDLFTRTPPDLVITDLSMPKMDGLELTRAIRATSEVPIIVLSVREQEPIKVAALDEGADDYVTKPFSMQELLARVRANLRKGARVEPPPTVINVGEVHIDTATRRVSVSGTEIHLTPKEFDLLLQLASHPDKVLTHRQLLRAVWGSAGDDQPEYLRVLVAQLRKKLDSQDTSRYIESEPWVGYRLRGSSNSSQTENDEQIG
jgi:two-component system KDP operon response regulator KdpE